MTAEQFYWKDWHTLNPNVPGESMILRICRFAEAYHRAESAAQLAEKEREIARLNKLFCDLTPGGSEFVNDADYCAAYLQKRRHALHEVAKNAVIRAQGAEQRLQEAQARIKELEEEVANAGELGGPRGEIV